MKINSIPEPKWLNALEKDNYNNDWEDLKKRTLKLLKEHNY